MPVEFVLFILRIVFIFALYFFILLVTRTMTRELTVRADNGAAGMPVLPATRGAVTPGQAHLTIVDGASTGISPGTAFAVSSGATVGRAPQTSIPLNDAFTSSEHARFRYERDRWYLDDLGSMNGSYINGKRIQGAAPLADGDTVQLGRVVVQFVLRAPQ